MTFKYLIVINYFIYIYYKMNICVQCNEECYKKCPRKCYSKYSNYDPYNMLYFLR